MISEEFYCIEEANIENSLLITKVHHFGLQFKKFRTKRKNKQINIRK